MKTGLILEGGAMRGMFTAGVLDVLMEQGITVDGMVGVSAGAVFGCNYKSHQIGRTIRYNTTYCKDKRYASFRNLLRTGNLYSEDFCYHEVPEKLDPFDDKAFRESPMDYFVVCTDVRTGDPIYHKCRTGDAEDVLWMEASASMPLAAKIVRIGHYGLLDGGVYCSLKHFPGHGDTSEDTHVGTVTLNKTLDDLRSCELVPFAQNVNNAPLIMAAHITVPQVTGDDTPASLSSVMLTDLLRGKLGYQGLIVTDSLAMQAITDVYTPGQAAVKALQAGADLLLMPNGLADAYTAVLEAVQDGTIPQQRLDESVQRILQCKYQYGILTQ